MSEEQSCSIYFKDVLVKTAVKTDWEKCALCQIDSRDTLQVPHHNYNLEAESGYKSLADFLSQCNGVFPIPLNIQRLDDGRGIEETMTSNCAKWHKSCRLKFYHKSAKRRQNDQPIETPQSEDDAEPCADGPTSCKRIFTRSNATVVQDECFFQCDSSDSSEILHLAATKDIDAKVRRCAEELDDQRVIASLSAGDMVAIGAKYHRKCLVTYYNRRRALHNDMKDNERADMMYESFAFAEIVTYIENKRSAMDSQPVFKLSDLGKMYVDILKGYGIHSKLRITNLKERLLFHFPDMEAYKKNNKNILIVFKSDVGNALLKAYGIDFDEDALTIAKAASIIRRDILQYSTEFSGKFEKSSKQSNIPESLSFLLSLIHKGSNIVTQPTKSREMHQSVSTIGQLIVFNCNITRRHQKIREPSIPVYLGLSLHSLTRKRSIVDTLYDLGLSISYDRVLDISTRLGMSICELYNAEQVVCPPNLLQGVFVTGSADNADHNPSSTTSKESFHGTVIQMNSHPSSINPGVQRCNIQLFEGALKSNSMPSLPDFYTEIVPLMKLNDNKTAPILAFDVPDLTLNPPHEETGWLEHVRETVASENRDQDVSWSSFHASQAPPTSEPTTVSGMLPLFEEQAHTPPMIRHAMNIVKSATQLLNPGQTPVITLDQPLYALAKKIQWNFPDVYGEDKFVVMFGGLHIEMAVLRMLGCLLEGSGWVESLTKASVAHQGTAESFTRVVHVTKTRRAHQITAAALDVLRHRAYDDEVDFNVTDLSFEAWCKNQEENVPQFKYWSTVLQLELLLLGFIRSIRSADFKSYKNMLTAIIPWCFALNRINYSRWLSIHLRDMAALEDTCPEVFQEYLRGNFVVKKSANPFSAMAIDQALEQTNAIIKGDGGAIGLLQNPEALRRWMIVGPEISRIISEFEESAPGQNKHHEQKKSFQNQFASDILSVVQVIEEFGNPFMETSKDLLRLHNREILPEEAVVSLYNIKALGIAQFNAFVDDRLRSQTDLVSNVIKKNKLHLFGTPPKKKITKQQLKITSLRNDCALFSRFYIGCQTRNGDLNKFFEHENNPCPPSISLDGQLRHGKKSDILACLIDASLPSTTEPTNNFDMVILDGAAIVNMLKPHKQLHTFQDYATKMFVPFITSRLQKAPRVDLIWDVYWSDSLKAHTRLIRGKGVRRRVEEMTTLPRNWQEFLRVDDNKRELFSLLGKFALNIAAATGTVVVTREEETFCNVSGVTLDTITPCNHEEADSRIILHIYDAFSNGCEEVLIKTVDSDVVVLCVVAASAFSSKRVWLEFGVGKHLRIIAAHEIAATLGPDKSAALPFFHAFTGCDTCSSFAGKGKKSAWKVWKILPGITDVFRNLSIHPPCITEEHLQELEKFVVILYDRTSTYTSVNKCRKELFTQKQVAMEALPPTQDALQLHVKRAALQAGFVWGSAAQSMQALPSPDDWGWMKSTAGIWEPRWTTLADAMHSCDEVIFCKCKHGCMEDVCSCLLSGQPCCASCKCRGDCN